MNLCPLYLRFLSFFKVHIRINVLFYFYMTLFAKTTYSLFPVMDKSSYDIASLVNSHVRI